MLFDPITSYIGEIAPLFNHSCIYAECKKVDETKSRKNKVNLLDMMLVTCDLSSPSNAQQKIAYKRVLVDI